MACTSARCWKYNHDCNKCFGLSPETVYNELWRGREFELTHLWQRSVFLAVFMLAIAGAYGTVLMKVVFPDSATELVKDKCEINKQDEQNKVFEEPFSTKSKQEILIGLTCLGSVFSLMWCMMAKGSKYWYERYEDGIQHFTTGSYTSELKYFAPEIPCHGNLPKGKNDNISDNPLSPLAGRYSVSKVNITIGIVSLFAWGVLGSIHAIKYMNEVSMLQNPLSCIATGTVLYFAFDVIAFILLRILCQSRDEKK